MKKPNCSKKIERKKEANAKTILIKKHILFDLAADTTIVAGVLPLGRMRNG
jgi:hypothetical protein